MSARVGVAAGVAESKASGSKRVTNYAVVIGADALAYGREKAAPIAEFDIDLGLEPGPRPENSAEAERNRAGLGFKIGEDAMHARQKSAYVMPILLQSDNDDRRDPDVGTQSQVYGLEMGGRSYEDGNGTREYYGLARADYSISRHMGFYTAVNERKIKTLNPASPELARDAARSTLIVGARVGVAF